MSVEQCGRKIAVLPSKKTVSSPGVPQIPTFLSRRVGRKHVPSRLLFCTAVKYIPPRFPVSREHQGHPANRRGNEAHKVQFWSSCTEKPEQGTGNRGVARE